MQTVGSAGKILLTFRSHDVSHERSGNSGGEQVCACSLKMALNYPSPVENCLFHLSDFFDDNIYSTSQYSIFKKKKSKKKIDSNLSRART